MHLNTKQHELQVGERQFNLIALSMHSTRLEKPPLTPGMKCTGFVLAAANRGITAGQENRERPRAYSQGSIPHLPPATAPFFPVPPWGGGGGANGRKRTLEHKRVEQEKGCPLGGLRTSPSILRPGSTKLARSLQGSATRDLCARGARSRRAQRAGPDGLRPSGHPLKVLQMLIIPSRHCTL